MRVLLILEKNCVIDISNQPFFFFPFLQFAYVFLTMQLCI